MGQSEDLFNKLNLPETRLGYDHSKGEFEHIEFKNNGKKYSRYINPYEKMVNMWMIDMNSGKNKISFETKAFYEKSLELSTQPNKAKMDEHNPIFLHIADSNDCRYYNLKN